MNFVVENNNTAQIPRRWAGRYYCRGKQVRRPISARKPRMAHRTRHNDRLSTVL
jgi:hypothetical protein